MMLGVSATSAICITFILYPLGSETSKRYGRVLGFGNEAWLKVIWLESPESIIHKSAFDLKCVREGL